MANSKVPRFGAWEGEENVQYTAYFETARKGKGGGPAVNPNEPQMNRDMLPRNQQPPRARSPPELPNGGGRGGVRSSSDQRVKASADPPPSRPDAASRRSSTNNEPTQPQRPTGGRGGGDPRGKPTVQPVASESPLNPRTPARNSAGPRSSDNKNSFDSSHGTPGRARAPPRRGSQTPERGPSVPEFGGWNKNPGQAESYTVVFNDIRKQRRGEGSEDGNAQSQNNNSGSKNNEPKPGCCFGWF